MNQYIENAYLAVKKPSTPEKIIFAIPKALENEGYRLYPIKDKNIDEALSLINKLALKEQTKKNQRKLLRLVNY